jgi:hypothetical protein
MAVYTGVKIRMPLTTAVMSGALQFEFMAARVIQLKIYVYSYGVFLLGAIVSAHITTMVLYEG